MQIPVGVKAEQTDRHTGLAAPLAEQRDKQIDTGIKKWIAQWEV